MSAPHASATPRLPPADRQRLDQLEARFSELRSRSIGYPCNQVFDYSELCRFLEFACNNVGDPFGASNYRMNTHDFERDVVHEFARLTQAPPDEYWGYVTSGGTEGNMYGLYVAREIFPQGICYFSEETHYSVAKILRLQHTRNIMIKSRTDGAIDHDDLRETLRLHRDVPPIIFANIGTTMKGAIDDLDAIRGILNDLAISEAYIHADAALSGMILPFVDEPQPWDFAAGIDSLSISGHKLLGSPLPCGVVLARKQHVDRIARSNRVRRCPRHHDHRFPQRHRSALPLVPASHARAGRHRSPRGALAEAGRICGASTPARRHRSVAAPEFNHGCVPAPARRSS